MFRPDLVIIRLIEVCERAQLYVIRFVIAWTDVLSTVL